MIMRMHFTIRNYGMRINTALTVCVMLFLSSCIDSKKEKDGPNIIFILVDDIDMKVY